MFQAFPFDKNVVHFELLLFESVHFKVAISSLVEQQWPLPIKFIDHSDIWKFIGMSTNVTTNSQVELSLARFYFEFKRKQEYYAMTLFLPLEIIMLLLLVTFILPPSDPGRPAYSITVNLSFTVMQQTAYAAIPKTSQRVHLFWYIAYYLIIGAFVTIHTLITLAVATRDPNFQKRLFCDRRMSKGDILELVGFLITIICLIAANVDYFYSVLGHNGNTLF